MTWTDLKRHIKYIDSIGNSSFEVAGIDLDSRQIKADYVFIAVRGLKSDGHDFISQAIESGAKAVVCEQYPGNIASGIEYIKVADTSISVGLVASAFYDFPSTKLKLVGVTGTNGKTTTATMLYRLIESFGYKAGLLSTVRNYIHDRVLDSSHTTPDAVRVNQLLADMVAAGCEYAFMEVSSHAMKQNRVQGLRFIGGIFTNLTHDHLDYHLTFDDYLKSKKKFCHY
jgi:UDP-N-acetylmuramoyl-L-alanyl-D-glutamate--2,6-diaminopimelate ligase